MPTKAANLLSVSVYETLRRGILTGRYGSQERISDVAIAKELDVSRTPVREALQRLEHDGLVSRDGRGKLTVTTVTEEDIANIYPIVAVLEGLAARLAAPQRTAVDLRRLRTLNSRMARLARTGDAEAFFNMNAAFHQVFIRRANNPRLTEEISKVRILMRRFRLVLMKTPGRMTTSADEHAAIVAAFAARDAKRAEAAVRQHLASAERTLRQVLEAVRNLA